jgi:hypothetical protein
MAETLAEIPFGVVNGDDNRDGYSHVFPRGNRASLERVGSTFNATPGILG